MRIEQERRKAGLAGALIIVTSLALILKAVGLHKTLVVDQSTTFPYYALDDRTMGGSSISSVEVVDNKIKLNCKIAEGSYGWPFCSLAIRLTDGKNGKGMDLSGYSHFKLWIKYEKPNDDHGIRFQARQIDPKYSSIDDESSLKYNTLEFYQSNSAYPMVVPLNRFQVPTWWLVWKGLSYEDGGTDFSNIYRLEVVTGYVISPGEHNIVVERIELVGELISGQDLYLILLGIWGSIGFLYLLNKLYFMRNALKISAERQQELEALSGLLEQKNQELKTRLTRNPITGALNKNGILDLFGRRGSDKLVNLSLMFIHVDHLKDINEKHGHEIGDNIIAKFANLLTENTRASDMVARWGEEEFVLVCSNASLVFAHQLAEKLRSLVEGSSWPLNLTVTTSIGVAEMVKESPLEFIDRVDKALDEAKNKGMNCVIAAP